MKPNNEYKIEILIGVIGLLISTILPQAGLSVEISWLIGILLVILPLCLVSLKYFLKKILIKAVYDTSITCSNSNLLTRKILKMKEPRLGYAQKMLMETIHQIEKIERGIITLSEAHYFDKIIEETKKLKKDDSVIAVNCFAERRFEQDPRERLYFEENVKAVRERDVLIHRIFVYNDIDTPSSDDLANLRAIKNNIDMKIGVSIVKKSSLTGRKDILISDWVMFDCDATRLYVDYQDEIDKTRISHGEIHLNKADFDKHRESFRLLKELSISESEISEMLSQI